MVATNNNTDTAQITENKVKQIVGETNPSLRKCPSNIKTVIDIGTTKISAIMGHIEKGKEIKVLTHSTVPCEGLRKGVVTDISATSRAIKLAIVKLQSLSGYKLDSAYVGVTGVHVSFTNRRDLMNRDNEPYVITKDSLTDNPEKFESMVGPERKLIHAETISYSIDGDEGIRNPVGMHSPEGYVEVDTHVVTGSSELLDKLNTAVESTGIKVLGMVLEPIASGIAVSTIREREQGVVVIDIGGGTTDLIAFKKGSVCYTDVIPVGGFQFTNDIAITFNTDYKSAEIAKLEYGTAELYPSNKADTKISFESNSDDSVIHIESDDISQLTRERAQELINLIRITLDDSELDDETKSHIVLTGGTSNLPGLADLMRRTIATKVRIGTPIMDGIPSELLNPSHATGVGILIRVLKNAFKGNKPNNKIGYNPKGKLKTGMLSRIGQIIKMQTS